MLFGSKGRRTSWRAGGRAHGDLLHLQGQAYRRSRTRGAAAHRYTRNTCGNAFLIYAYNNTGGGLGLVVVRARDQSRGRACRAGGRVRSAPQGQTYCSWRSHITRGAVVRCAMCGVCRCAMCVVCRVSLKIKKSNTKMVYRPALRRRARSGAAPARRRATPLCKKTRGGEINT